MERDGDIRALMGQRAFYAASVAGFLATDRNVVFAALAASSSFAIEPEQRDAWVAEIEVMGEVLGALARDGLVAFEYTVPRVGRRIDVLAVIGPVVFVIEFKVGESSFTRAAIDQVWDYCLDLKNFHSTSHAVFIAPVLVATGASAPLGRQLIEPADDGVLAPLCSTLGGLTDLMREILDSCSGPPIESGVWARGSYLPTPTIIEAARALYAGHDVREVSRSDAGAQNLRETSARIGALIREARDRGQKSLCLVTGVPGAGKTLVGLNVATAHMDRASDLYSVFLSGNGPLVAVLREALARDAYRRNATPRSRRALTEARTEVKAFIQNVHHFRDECLQNDGRPPPEHVAIFDEAQRAWTLEQTQRFMAQKKKRPNFAMSEPEFLLSCMDRHPDWAVVVCLVGGGQEINTGEAGIGEWLDAVRTRFSHWRVHLSPHLHDAEYAAGASLARVNGHPHVHTDAALHLAVSMRSFRAENVSAWVKAVLDIDLPAAQSAWQRMKDRYPVVLTRDLPLAKQWLRGRARGNERFGIVVSSQASRLKPHAIDVRLSVNPIHWFLHGREDVRSSFYLEDAATEFRVQGLELDWACVVWDGDLRFGSGTWSHWRFRGKRWERVRAADRRAYQKNAYRVLLTRARQGMVIVVPEGDRADPTRDPDFYDSTFEYLRAVGVPLLIGPGRS